MHRSHLLFFLTLGASSLIACAEDAAETSMDAASGGHTSTSTASGGEGGGTGGAAPTASWQLAAGVQTDIEQLGMAVWAFEASAGAPDGHLYAATNGQLVRVSPSGEATSGFPMTVSSTSYSTALACATDASVVVVRGSADGLLVARVDTSGIELWRDDLMLGGEGTAIGVVLDGEAFYVLGNHKLPGTYQRGPAIARYSLDGTRDAGFAPDLSQLGQLMSGAVDPTTGELMVLGWAGTSADLHMALRRVNAAGELSAPGDYDTFAAAIPFGLGGPHHLAMSADGLAEVVLTQAYGNAVSSRFIVPASGAPIVHRGFEAASVYGDVLVDADLFVNVAKPTPYTDMTVRIEAFGGDVLTDLPIAMPPKSRVLDLVTAGDGLWIAYAQNPETTTYTLPSFMHVAVTQVD
jgi:hypothetical protein